MFRFKAILGGFVFILLATACEARVRDGGEVVMYGYGYNEDVPEIASIENEFLRLDFFTESAQITVTNKQTGEIFYGSPPSGDENASVVERARMQSLFVLEYENRQGSSWIYDSYRFSVIDERFRHDVIDGVLELNFTVGNFPQTFIVPTAIYEERLSEFLDKMSRQESMMVQSLFRPLHIDRLRASDNVAELTARFPTLAEGRTIYVAQDVAPFVMESVEESLANTGYTYEDYLEDMAYFGETVGGDRPEFNLTMRFELDGPDMVVSVPLANITYNPLFLPARLTLLPYFGAGDSDDEGYLFVPDGSGALMYFGSGRHNQSLFHSNVYGWDEAILRDALIHDNRAPYPVFGIYKNGQTFATIIEQGASFASVRAELAGMNASYSRVHTVFRLMQSALLDVAGRADTQLLMHEWDLQREENLVLRYVFPENSGYVGMAEAYRGFLQARYPWLNEPLQEPTGAMVEILGAALTNQHFLGFPVELPDPLTSYRGAANIINELNNRGWDNISVMLRGAHNGSIDHSVPTRFRLISRMGGRQGFNELLDASSASGFPLYIEAEFVFMRNNTSFNGFSRLNDSARQINRNRVEHNGFNHVYFGEHSNQSALRDPTILANPEFTQRTIREFTRQASQVGVNNIAFRSLASALSGDFNENKHVNREKSKNMRIETLSELRENNMGVWLNYGFDFAVPFANVVTGMPLDDSGFAITDVSVPFMQIALHGLVNFAGRPVNLAEDYSQHLLKSIESGANIFFSFMDAATREINTTTYRRYFANEFARWVDVADELYKEYQANFGRLYNKLIIDHKILTDGVTLTVYEDGTHVYVNYSNQNFENEDGDIIPPRFYLVIGGGA